MLDSFQIKKPIYPIFTILSAILIFVGALLLAKSPFGIIFLLAVYILLMSFGYVRTCLKMIPFLIVYLAVFHLIFYYASHKNLEFAVQMGIRLAGVVIAFIPGISLPPVNLVRNLTQLHFPRLLTLGMLITLTFIPVLSSEIKQVRNAMKTRGATSLWKPVVLYRAFLIPLIVRLVNISDTLTLSVETRAFVSDDLKPSVYRTVKVQSRDIVFAVIFMLIFIASIVLSKVIDL
ncbi:MAG: energy-coupling factor transporter transmembrane protein EcfT [Treponemataceae bacterium]|nr:energy-coupling factor transporter transmembrane protein EcfT [Treponemataceae bacterium]